jgi:hypothetical protein
MAVNTLSQIKTAIGVGARPNLFRVSFAGGFAQGLDSTNFSILVKAAQLPGSTHGTIEVPTGGGRRYKIAGDRTFAEWTTTVLNDSNMNARRVIEAYQTNFVYADYETFASVSPGGRTTNSLLSTVTVQQLNQAGAAQRTYTLNSCFVSDISAVDLSYDSTDAISEFTVTWVYDYFTVV